LKLKLKKFIKKKRKIVHYQNLHFEKKKNSFMEQKFRKKVSLIRYSVSLKTIMQPLRILFATTTPAYQKLITDAALACDMSVHHNR
jgi:hypothetical protein